VEIIQFPLATDETRIEHGQEKSETLKTLSVFAPCFIRGYLALETSTGNLAWDNGSYFNQEEVVPQAMSQGARQIGLVRNDKGLRH
jgi:hypothetical protein